MYLDGIFAFGDFVVEDLYTLLIMQIYLLGDLWLGCTNS